MSFYKFFGWQVEKGYWRGQKLVPLSAVASMRQTLSDRPTFASVQTYDEQANVMFCPLYADLDGQDPKQALFDAQYIVYLLGEMSNIVPDIYYSGNRGYHIIVPYLIEHPQCHLVAKHFFEHLAAGITSLDRRVYRTQAMLRLPNSPASRPGYYKVQLTKSELMTMTPPAIAELAKMPRVGRISEYDGAQVNDEFLGMIAEGIRRIPRYTGQVLAEYMRELGDELTPCLVRILEEGAGKGQRNQGALLLGRMLKKCGFTQGAATEMLLHRKPWQDFEDDERGVSRCFKSLWQSNRMSVIGCKVGSDASLMQSFCDPMCWFNEEKFEFSFRGKGA